MAYLYAKFEKRRTDLYAMDLIWAIARNIAGISDEARCPTDIEQNHKPKDTRSAAEIRRDIIRKVQGL